jgi:hypothetical protein
MGHRQVSFTKNSLTNSNCLSPTDEARLQEEWVVVLTISPNSQKEPCKQPIQRGLRVGSMCHTIERTDRQTGLSGLLGLQSEPKLLPYHSSLLIIYIKAAMLVFDL